MAGRAPRVWTAKNPVDLKIELQTLGAELKIGLCSVLDRWRSWSVLILVFNCRFISFKNAALDWDATFHLHWRSFRERSLSLTAKAQCFYKMEVLLAKYIYTYYAFGNKNVMYTYIYMKNTFHLMTIEKKAREKRFTRRITHFAKAIWLERIVIRAISNLPF